MPRWIVAPNRLGGPLPTRQVDVIPGVRDAQNRGNYLDPGSYFSIAAREVSARHPPELNAALQGIYIADTLPPQRRGEYRTNGVLTRLREDEPLLTIPGIRELMGHRPYGRIMLNPHELPNLQEALGTIGHEYLHHTRNYEDPKFNYQNYVDTLQGSNPYAEPVFKWIAKQNPTIPIEKLRYAKHPEEKEALIAKLEAMGLLPPRLTKNDRHLAQAYDNYQVDLHQDFENDPRWEEAAQEALMENMHNRGLLEAYDFDERQWSK